MNLLHSRLTCWDRWQCLFPAMDSERTGGGEKLSKSEALQEATNHLKAAIDILYKSGFSYAEALETLQGILMNLLVHM